MDALPDENHSHPDSWRIEAGARAAVLSAVTVSGTKPLFELRGIQGSFILSASGLLSGFALDLDLPERPLRTSRWGRSPSRLSWTASDLQPSETGAHGIEGRGALTLGSRETRPTLSGTCAPVPYGRTGVSYLKIVLETVFASAVLWWPREARRRLRPVRLTLFAEIRPGRVGSGVPPHLPDPRL